MEILQSGGLQLIQKIDVGQPVLDVAFYQDTMFISLDSNKGTWVAEYQYANGTWQEADSTKWEAMEMQQNHVDLYWLESMRKTVGPHEEDE